MQGGGNFQMMTRMALVLILIVTLVVVGCGNQTTGGIVGPTWIDAQVEGNAVSIPAGEVDSGKMIHFELTSGQGDGMTFMAYKLGGKTYVRAAVCEPCQQRGKSFSLDGEVLICDICGTSFKAGTSEGISGSCKVYPKTEVAHAITGDKITMMADDLVTAYLDTERPG
jgi:uncharacterized membrane protein